MQDVSTESMPFRTGDVVRIQRNEKFIDPAQRSHDSSVCYSACLADFSVKIY